MCESLFIPKLKKFGGLAGEPPITARGKFVHSIKVIWLYLTNPDVIPLRYTKSKNFRAFFDG